MLALLCVFCFFLMEFLKYKKAKYCIAHRLVPWWLFLPVVEKKTLGDLVIILDCGDCSSRAVSFQLLWFREAQHQSVLLLYYACTPKADSI